MAYKKTKDEDDFLSTARDRFKTVTEAESEIRKNFASDLSFYDGDQWPSDIKAMRELRGNQRPCLVINRLPQFVHQITNNIRQNKPAPNVSPVDDGGDKETAEIFQGIIRHIERQSKADIARSYASFYQVVCGRGYYRIETKFADPKSFDQEIFITRIKNPACVYFDPKCLQPDYSDARYAFIVHDVSRDEYERRFPDADEYSAEDLRSIGDSASFWLTDDDSIRIAEYFTRTLETVTIALLQDGTVLPLEEVPEGAVVVKQRSTEVPVVNWCTINGSEVLEEEEWPGQWIPIIPVLGEEYDINGKTQLLGMVRHSKDPQRMLNYWESCKTEAIALAPRAPFLVAEGQTENHEEEWAQANSRNYPYLIYKATTVQGHPVPPPQRQVYEPPIQAITAAEMGAIENMKAATGIYDASLGNRSNETSGIGIRQRQIQGDVANFHFVDNLTTAITHEGRILVDLIPHIYDRPGRVMRIIGEDGTEQSVPVNTRFQKRQNGALVTDQMQFDPQQITKIYDLSAGRYDVAVAVGPSYATKRQESAESMMQFAQVAPELVPRYADLLVTAMDWPGADAIADRIRPPDIPKEGEPPIPPQAQAAMQQMQQQNQELQAQLQQASEIINTQKLQIDSAERMQMRDIESKQMLAERKAQTDIMRDAGKIHSDVLQTDQKVESQESIAQLNAETKITAEQMKLGAKKEQQQQKPPNGSFGGGD
jgi:hypothetical protein